jgi:hypothetical protein
MKKIVRVLAALSFALALISPIASAGTAALTWTIPISRTDGSALPASQYAGTLLEYGTCSSQSPLAFGVKGGEFFLAGIGQAHTFTLSPATYCFRAFARDTASVQSVATNPVLKVVVDAPPNPPGSLAVVATTAFNVVKQRDRLVLVAVGTVPANTACDTSYSVNGHYVVPRDAVTWFGSVRPEVVVSLCQPPA